MKKKKRGSVRISSRDAHIAGVNHKLSSDPYNDTKSEEKIN